MAIHNVEIELSPGRTVTVETGKIAKLAGGSVTLTMGDTVLLVCACSDDPRPGLDFFPLQVDYREKFSAAGRMPGGYFKREGRPSEKEILTARMTDRPLRPLFPKGFIDDVQIMALLLSADGENEPDVLCMLGASAALCVSDIPFGGPVGACRVGRVNGELIANPTHSEMEDSDLDLVYAGVADKTIMIEGAADELSEDELSAALAFANEVVKVQIAKQQELAAAAGKAKYTPNKLRLLPDDLVAAVRAHVGDELRSRCQIVGKEERNSAMDELRDQTIEALLPTLEGDASDLAGTLKDVFHDEITHTIRDLLLSEGKRMDGRSPQDLREICCEVGVLPRTHGSGLFSRGETQGLVITTLGGDRDSQDSDGITGGESSKRFYLHYNFPNYSVGETGRIMGPGRREIGHGALAERSVARMVPKDYPYAVRCLSEIMGSNGSTSMASICGASLSLMDAGVPLIRPVAGISVGLVLEDDKYVLITDILGSEDHHGDMDFKVAGTTEGITGFQLDLKTPGISLELMHEAMLQNKVARDKILASMNACISEPRDDVSPYAPQLHVLQINPDKIGALIGPGGKVIKGITESIGCDINIEDDGTVKIYAKGKEVLDKAIEAVQEVVAEVEVGKIYRGPVKGVKEFGAFVEVLPGQEGLLHISELADYRVGKVEDICVLGDVVPVKVIDIDERGRMRLSRRAALEELGAEEESSSEE
jgi:polyribonucleotide nucleotidyltransferase